MKLPVVAFALVIASAVAAAQSTAQAPPIDRLRAAVERVTKSVNATWGIYVKSLDTGEELALDADRQMETMSTIKIPLMVEALQQIKASLTPAEQKKVQALVNDPAVMADVQRDVERGMKAALSQTPTVMVTYKLRQQPWTNFVDYTLFRGYIDGLLKK